jgi:hypothetical protein
MNCLMASLSNNSLIVSQTLLSFTKYHSELSIINKLLLIINYYYYYHYNIYNYYIYNIYHYYIYNIYCILYLLINLLLLSYKLVNINYYISFREKAILHSKLELHFIQIQMHQVLPAYFITLWKMVYFLIR